jgi:hypothetical protein
MPVTTFTWASATGGDWKTATNWTPTGGPPNSGSGAAALFGELSSSYVGTIAVGESFSVSTLEFSTNDSSKTVGLNVGGTLTIGTLDYQNTVSHAATTLSTISGGTIDVTGSIVATIAETINVTGSGPGSLFEVGTATGLDSAHVTEKFANGSAGSLNAGVIEVAGGSFVSGGTLAMSVSQFGFGDALEFPGAFFSSGAGDKAVFGNTGTILIENSSSNVIFTLTGVSKTGGVSSLNLTGNEIVAVCYARGTMIRTPDGEIPVERLRAGRQVMTLVGGDWIARTVKWLGHRRMDLKLHPRPETVMPVRIVRDAFADQVPHRDLIVSPDHAIFVDGKLICARQLVNGTTVRQETDWTTVDYYHVELDQHAILLAEGLPAESYLNTGNIGFFSNSGAPLVLHPDLTDEADHPTREAGSCAPFVWDADSVRPVWQSLADRAAALGWPVARPATTGEAELRLFAKGRTVKPVYTDDKLVIFALPRHATGVRLVSRSARPTDASPWLEDRRKLGVRVARVVLRTSDDVQEVPVDYPGLAKGWWAVERDGVMLSRWTNGDAVLPLPAMDGDALLEIHLAGGMTYVADSEASAQRRAA